MPPKRQHNTRTQGKEEVAQKVKEIKQRQQNWFKQREQSVTSEKVEDASEPKHGVGRAGGQGDIPRSKAGGFNSWMAARSKEDKPAVREQRRTPLGASYVISKEQTDRDTGHSQVTTGQLHSSSLPPEDFDQLADQILSRVKNQLNGKPYYAKQYEDLVVSEQTKPPTPHTPAVSERSERTTPCTTPQQHGADTQAHGGHADGHPDGHLCPQCNHIMTGPREPLLAIPCGHNLCRLCSQQEDVDLCAVCSCEVSTFTANIMLKQIIGDFRRDRKRAASTRKAAVGREEEEEKDYKQEIQSLMLRLDVLESESDNIRDAMATIQRDIAQEKKQVAGIERQEERVRDEIAELHGQLDALSNHKQQYSDRCERLEEKHAKQEDKLTMVKDTIRQLNRDVEKLQLNSGGDS